MNRDELIRDEERFGLPTYAKYPLLIDRGKDCHVFDADGRRFLDFYGGHAVALAGHCHPAVVAAIREQAGRLLFYSNAVYNDARARALAALGRYAPAGLGRAFLCNSGAEANETALKIARRYTRRPELVAFEGGFHGRTLGALSVTGYPKYREGIGPIPEGVRFARFGEIDSVRALVGPATAAVILEPVQSMAGCRTAEPEFYRELRKLCDHQGALLIFDEVQTGLGRTGKPFAGDHWGVTPDCITLAKGIGSGLPAAALLVREEIAATVKEGEQGTTFGGGPLACAAIEATLGVIERERLAANAAQRGEELRAGLLRLPKVERIDGLGLLLGVRLKGSAKEAMAAFLAKGVLIGTSQDPSVARLLPPLTIGDAEVAEFLEAAGAVLA